MGKCSLFVTCGGGMDYFVTKELSNERQVVNIECGDGKVFFDFLSETDKLNDSDVERLLQIKSAERLFISACKIKSSCHVAKCILNNCQTWKKSVDILALFRNHEKNAMPRGREPHGTGEISPPSKKLKHEEVGEEISFRVSCKCTGRISRKLPREKLTKIISYGVRQDLNWVPDLRNPLMEIYAHLNDELIVIGFPVTKLPLSKRPYLRSINLRSPVCWAMGYCGSITSNDVVLDPMCGAGTILVEISKSWPVKHVIGVDINAQQLQQTLANCHYAGVQTRVDLIQGNVAELPIKDLSVNAVLCDFPFGLKHGKVQDVKKLLPQAVKEINRTCSLKSRIVILISKELLEDLTNCVADTFPRRSSSTLVPRKFIPSASIAATSRSDIHLSWWKHLSNNHVKLGELHAVICTFQKL